jgi:hypothetical protein
MIMIDNRSLQAEDEEEEMGEDEEMKGVCIVLYLDLLSLLLHKKFKRDTIQK